MYVGRAQLGGGQTATISNNNPVVNGTTFSQYLVTAVGKENFDRMPWVTVEEKGTGYLDRCFSLDMIPESGAIRGVDQLGRPFVTFAVVNPRYKESHKHAKEMDLITIFKRDFERGFYCHRHCTFVPTDDSRFFASNLAMTHDKYHAIKEIFDGTHKDLILGTFENRIKCRETVLKESGLSEEEVATCVDGYRNELNSPRFSRNLIEAVGEENFNRMPWVPFEEIGTGYSDYCFSLDMIPESGAIRGVDQRGRLYITFAVVNPNYQEIERPIDVCKKALEEVALITIVQINERGYYDYRDYEEIPTKDERFFYDSGSTDPKYEAMKEVFNGTHQDLILGTFENRIKCREAVLKKSGLSEEEVAKGIDTYKKELKSINTYKKELCGPSTMLSTLNKV